MKSIIFLVSGGGGNLKFLYFGLINNLISGCRLSVIADRECGALDFAREHNIENHLVIYNRSEPEAFKKILQKTQPDIIITNWHKIIDKDTIEYYSGKFVNLHYSLLPAFSGLIGVAPIKRAYEQGCKFIGPTCHLVDEGVDTGKILAQAVFTTDRSFEEAVNLMFRYGCLVLLNGIQQVLGQSLLRKQSSTSWATISPTLEFDESLLSEEFWSNVAAL